MKKQNILYLFLTLLITISLINAVNITADAKVKTNKTILYAGETHEYCYKGVGDIESLKSSNKRIVSVKKLDEHTVVINAKKHGKAVLTIKGTKGSYKHTIIVKDSPNIKLSIVSAVKNEYNSYAVLKIENSSEVYMDNIDIMITFKDYAGNPLYKVYDCFDYIGANTIAYKEVYCGYNNASLIDPSNTTFEYSYKRSLNHTYKNIASNINYKLESFGEYNNITISADKTIKKSDYYAGYSILYKDINGNITGADDGYVCLNGKSKTYTIRKYLPDNTVSAEIVAKRAFSIKNK